MVRATAKAFFGKSEVHRMCVRDVFGPSDEPLGPPGRDPKLTGTVSEFETDP